MTWNVRALTPLILLAALACSGDDEDKTDTGSTDTDTDSDADTDADADADADSDTDSDADTDVTGNTGDTGEVMAAFTLQLLHFADVDSNEATALDAVDEFSALVDGFSGDAMLGGDTLLVSSGDNLIPGPRWFAAEDSTVRAISGSNEPGSADHYMMNAMGVVASAVGNHELDQGPGEFADSFQAEAGGGAKFPGTRFPYLASNIDFSGEGDFTPGTAGDEWDTLGATVAESATVTLDSGEVIGLVGVSTPDLPSITTTGDLIIDGSITTIADLAAAVQPSVDDLVTSGVDKIVVLAHLQQLANEKALAAELEDVDIIVAGGSNTRMGDSTDALFPGDKSFDETYPFETTGADGNPLLIVNVDGDYKYLGRLVVGFDANGIVLPSTIDLGESGAYASTKANVAAAGGTANADVVAMRDAVDGVITLQYDNVIGHTDVFLEGRRTKVRTEETNLGNLTSDANKWYAEQCTEITNVVSLKNGGGIRAEIGDVVVVGTDTFLNPPSNVGLPTAVEGDVSEGHMRGTLRFDNGLVVVDVTGVELKLLLEHGVAQTTAGATPGQFPQVGGISFGYDPTGTAQVLTFDKKGDVTGIKTAGDRVQDLIIDTNGDGIVDTALYLDGVEQGAASNTYSLVTLNFLANGGDDYPYTLLANPNRRHVYAGLGFGDPDDGAGNPIHPQLTSCDPGAQSTFSDTGGEQDALAEYFIAAYPDAASPFDIAETAPVDDRRIQDLTIIKDFVAPQLEPLVITATYDGPLAGGTPKGIELYALESISDLSICGVGSANNGGGTDGEELTLSGSAKAGDFIYVASDSTQFNAFFGFKPDFVGDAASINGDDAIELFCNGVVVDVFGDIDTDGTGQAWEHLDGWAYRNNATGPDGTTFDVTAWTFSGVDALDGEKTNATATTPVPLGTYTP